MVLKCFPDLLTDFFFQGLMLACRLGGIMHFSSPEDNTRIEARAKSAYKKEKKVGRVGGQR